MPVEDTVKAASKVVAGIVKNNREPSVTAAEVLTEEIPTFWPRKTSSDNTKSLFRFTAEAVSIIDFFKVEEWDEEADF